MEVVGKRLARYASGLGMLAVAAVALSTLASKGPVLFAWHPILSTAAFLGTMCAGSLAYVGPLEERKVNRETHRTLQIFTGVLLLLGATAIVLNKMRIGKSVWPVSAHAWLGTLAVALTFGQCAVGLSKYAQIGARGFSNCKFHGDMGRATFAVGAVAIATGLVKIFSGVERYALLVLTQSAAGLALLVSLRCYPAIFARYATVRETQELQDSVGGLASDD
ncbi:hypothetical protein KFE25_002810 [Diacronema lutheri]|uniref:Cytochrome b561 domain-containing protein n=2 Tax=Diacronema lutheri TaxID=2081491 RepID=A0A8J6CFC7_DIALT|nr:hypothetical protein KFE25_002810 [Diacronema lutheri]